MPTIHTDNILLQTIKAALPDAMIVYVDNFDDYYFGWEICPQPGVMIRFQAVAGDEYTIKITKYVINAYSLTLNVGYIYTGGIPISQNSEPDYNFIRQILANWRNFG